MFPYSSNALMPLTHETKELTDDKDLSAGECLVVAARRWAGHESEHEASRCVEVDEYGSESEFDTGKEAVASAG